MDQSTSSTCSDVQDFLLHQIRQDFSHFDVICTSGTRRIEVRTTYQNRSVEIFRIISSMKQCMEWSSQLGIKDDVVTQRSQISQHSHLKNINNAIRSVLRQYYSDV